MARHSDEMQYLIDRAAIQELLARYFQGLDRSDPGQVRGCFTDDVRCHYDRRTPTTGIEELMGSLQNFNKLRAGTMKITTHFMALFAKFVEKLKTAPEGDGSVLDHSLIAFGTGMSDGQAHNDYPLPFTLIGGAGGRLKGNRFIVAPERTSIANVWLSVADMFGTPLEKFGESTSRLQL